MFPPNRLGTSQPHRVVRRVFSSLLIGMLATIPLVLLPTTASAGDGSAQLSLPWATGESWTLLTSLNGTGAHAWGSGTATSSLDFSGGSGNVRAAAAGTVQRDSCGGSDGYVRIDHGNGWHTTYYHLKDMASGLTNGSQVTRGQFLGKAGSTTPCGGSAPSGDHLHFTLWYFTSGTFNFTQQANILGVDLGGWTVGWDAAQTKTYMQRVSDGAKKYINEAIYNDGSVGSGSPNRTMIINSASAAYAQDGLGGPTSWTRMTGNGDATAIAAAGNYTMIINSAGAAYAQNTLGGQYGWTRMSADGDARAIAVSSTGRFMIITAAWGAWGQVGINGQYGWTRLTGDGDAKFIAVGGNRFAVITSANSAWAQDGLGGQSSWTRMTADGDATAIAVGESGRMMIINGSGTAYAQDNLGGQFGWTQMTGVGDARAIAVGNTRMMIISAAWAAWAQDGVGGPTSWTRMTSDGGSGAIAGCASNRTMIINAVGAAYAQDGLGGPTSWTRMTGDWDSQAIAC